MRINAVITEQAMAPKGMSDILGKLDMGDIVRAKVLEITSGELMLKLFDGTVFTAATASVIDAAPGENLELIVKGNNGGTLVLETVKKDVSNTDNSSNEAVKLLNELHIKTDTQNMQLAGEIKKAGINATKDIFDKAAQLLDKFTALSPEKAVFLSTKSISSEPRTINTAIRLIEGNLKLGSQLEDLHSMISKLTEDRTTEKTSASSKEVSLKHMSEATGIVPNNIETHEVVGKLQYRQSSTTDNSSDNKKNAVNINSSTNIEGNTDTAALNEAFIKTQQRTTDMSLNKAMENKQGNTALMRGMPEIEPTETVLLNIVEQHQDIPLNQDNTSEASNKQIKELAGKLKEAFKGLFVNTDSEKLSSELDVKKIYKEILDKLDSIKQISQASSLTERSDIAARVDTIEEGMKLLNQLSTNNVYVQIPLNLSGFNTTGELYIIKKDKNKKRIDPQNAVMLISLDTKNLGRVETLIDVKGKNVGINLRAEEQKVIDFFRDNYRHLYSSLLDKGYRLVDVKYRLLEEGANPVNVERLVRKELEDGRISVDLKI